MSAPVYSSGGTSLAAANTGSAEGSAPTSFVDVIQQVSAPASSGRTVATIGTSVPNGSKAPTALFALAGGASHWASLGGGKNAAIPARSTGVAEKQTDTDSSGASETDSDSPETADVPAAANMPVAAGPVLPVGTDVAAIRATAVPAAVLSVPNVTQPGTPVDSADPAPELPVAVVADKDSSPKQPTTAASNTPHSQAAAPQTTAPPVETLPIPMDVMVPQTNVRPRLSDTSEDSSARPAESSAQSATSTASQPEAAVNVVIQTGQTPSSPAAPVPTGADTALPVQIVPMTSAAVVIPAVVVEPDRKKADVADAAPVSGAQSVTVTDMTAKAEPARVDQHVESKTETPASAPQEPIAPEKAQQTQLKSLSLEFTPDGAKDVRVRIAERAGEVHVSLHSSDPGVAKDLRAGAADLGSALTQAGYDAQTWTSGRQQQNPQQQREEASQSNRSANKSGESFDGLMTGNTEN